MRKQAAEETKLQPPRIKDGKQVRRNPPRLPPESQATAVLAGSGRNCRIIIGREVVVHRLMILFLVSIDGSRPAGDGRQACHSFDIKPP